MTHGMPGVGDQVGDLPGDRVGAGVRHGDRDLLVRAGDQVGDRDDRDREILLWRTGIHVEIV